MRPLILPLPISIGFLLIGCSEKEDLSEDHPEVQISGSATHVSMVTLRKEPGNDVNDEFGIRLIEISPESVTVESTYSGQRYSAGVGEYFSGDDFGRRGLFLRSIEMEAGEVELVRTYATSLETIE